MTNIDSPTPPTPVNEVKPAAADAPVVVADKPEQKKTDAPAKA